MSVVYVDFKNRNEPQSEPETMKRALQRLFQEIKDQRAMQPSGEFEMAAPCRHREDY